MKRTEKGGETPMLRRITEGALVIVAGLLFIGAIPATAATTATIAVAAVVVVFFGGDPVEVVRTTERTLARVRKAFEDTVNDLDV